MTNELIPKDVTPINWKEVKITGITTLITAAIGCTVAVVVAQTLIIPFFNKLKEKKASAKSKDAAKA